MSAVFLSWEYWIVDTLHSIENEYSFILLQNIWTYGNHIGHYL